MLEPLTITLRPTDDELDEDFALRIRAWTKSLEGAGFKSLGDFDAHPTLLWLRALIHPESGAAAAFDVMPMAGAWYDVSLRFADSSSVTLTDNQREMADMPPWAKLVRLDAGTPPAKAYERLLRLIDSRQVSPYTPENFCGIFEDEYRRGTLWRIKRGDSEAEIRRITAADDGETPDNEFVHQIMDSRKQMRAYQIDEMLKEQWLKESNVSAFDYEQMGDRIVVVHDLTPPDVLADIWDEVCGEDDDEEPADALEVVSLVSDQGPRQAFRTLQQRLPPDVRFRHHAAVAGDIPGDLWLRPEEF